MADWCALPDMNLGLVFSHLSLVDKVVVSKVCSSWANAVLTPEAWKSFIYTDYEVTDLQTDSASSEKEFEKDLIDLIKCVSKYFKNVNICFRSKLSLEILASVAENSKAIKHLRIVRQTEIQYFVRSHDNTCESFVKRILQNNNRLQCLYLRDIDSLPLTEKKIALPIGVAHSNSLTKLTLIQCYQNCNLSSLMYLVNLKELTVEQNLLTYSLLHHLAGNSLRDLHIMAVTRHCEMYTENLQNEHWKEIKQQNPDLRVHGHFSIGHDWVESEIILKRDMPVQSLHYLKYTLLNYESLTGLVCNYAQTLVEFIDYSALESSYPGRGMRPNLAVCTGLMQIVNTCHNLKIITVKERIFSCVLVAMVLKRRDLNIMLLKSQVFFDELVPDLNLIGYSHAEVDMIRNGCLDLSSLLELFQHLTGQSWHFYTHNELSKALFSNQLYLWDRAGLI